MSATAQTTLARLRTERLVAVIGAGGAEQAVRAGRALAAGGDLCSPARLAEADFGALIGRARHYRAADATEARR